MNDMLFSIQRRDRSAHSLPQYSMKIMQGVVEDETAAQSGEHTVRQTGLGKVRQI